MIKALIAFLLALGATIVGARLAFEATATPTAPAAIQPWALNKMEFVAWNGERWTAWLRDGRFELVPAREGKWHRHSNTSIAFIDWDGEEWQARLDGAAFVLAHRGDWRGPAETARAIRYLDWAGNRQLRTVAHLSR